MVRGDVPHDDGDAEQVWEHRRVAEALATRVQGTPTEDVPGVLCRACLEFLPVSGVSLSVCGSTATVRTLLCASDELAAQLAEIQYTLGEGPCQQAVALRAPVFAPDLAGGPDTRRWPLFAAQAVRVGAAAAFSVPLGDTVTALGTLDMYRTEPGSLSARDVRVAVSAADALTLAILALDRRSQDTDGVVGWLQEAEADRDEVHQATGMIMVALGVDAEEALLRLRARAFAQGRTVTDVGRDIVDRTIDISSHD